MPHPIQHSAHLLGIAGLTPEQVLPYLDLAESYALLSRSRTPPRDVLRGKTVINLFFEDSTRTRTSFELAGKRLGADVVNMTVATSSVNKGETLLDTASTLNAMRCDLLVIRHAQSGAPALLAQKVEASVVNAGDGMHEHPTQALLDALTIRRHFGRFEGLEVAICGDIAHSRVARSDILLLRLLGARIRLAGPPTLLPSAFGKMAGVTIHRDMDEAVTGADVVMCLRVQRERMGAGLIPSTREYFALFGLDQRRLGLARDHAIVMHPGPMNRGVEIASEVADSRQSVISEQVEMGVAVRMAVLDRLSRSRRNHHA
ncbi:aspartate carbamoyltransferase catalytic subunit [Formicincola oecophyllae]|uniref:Aspartate carbamoyltransferase n=2 Tax=Formicincola oecophyllae TaxID=2558361 RepID=A0A4Y6UA77_9PROT|nr:aspartate carbamoyltransferase catalytic subunit [Formicincola oecophyllae]